MSYNKVLAIYVNLLDRQISPLKSIAGLTEQ